MWVALEVVSNIWAPNNALHRIACKRRFVRLLAPSECERCVGMDLLIATHALAEDCTLISADRVFARVPGLRVLDWAASPNK